MTDSDISRAITGQSLRPAQAAETEPTLTLTQLTALLREAAAYERAQRPIVIASAAPEAGKSAHPAAITAPVGAAHPGIEVTVPAPTAPAPSAAAQGRGLRRLFTRAEAAYLMGLSGLTAGTGAVVADALGPWAFTIPVAAAAACLTAAAAVNRDEQRAITEITADHHAYTAALHDGTAPRLPLMPHRRTGTAPELSSSLRAER